MAELIIFFMIELDRRAINVDRQSCAERPPEGKVLQVASSKAVDTKILTKGSKGSNIAVDF